MELNEELKSLKTLHYALCFGALFIIILLHFFIQPISFSSLGLSNNPLVYVGLFIAGWNLIMSQVLFRKKITAIGDNTKVAVTEQYRQAYVLKWALLEGALLINTLFYFMTTKNSLNIIAALFLLIILFLSKPSLNEV